MQTDPLAPLRFDAESHEYYWNGKRVPGVSEIHDAMLGPEFPDSAVVQRAADRGTAVHEACSLEDMNDLDEASVDPVVAPRLAAWRLFKREAHFHPSVVEKQLYSPYGFAGTLDRGGIFAPDPAPLMAESVLDIVDIKTSAKVSPRWRLKMAAYAILAEALRFKVRHRRVVRLLDDGTYRIEPYENHAQDRNDFMSLLRGYQLRKEMSRAC